MTATALTATRAQSAVQRAYVYVVALVAVHMIVLGAANILRVFAELGLGAPIGNTPAQMAAATRKEAEMLAGLAKAAGIEPE